MLINSFIYSSQLPNARVPTTNSVLKSADWGLEKLGNLLQAIIYKR